MAFRELNLFQNVPAFHRHVRDDSDGFKDACCGTDFVLVPETSRTQFLKAVEDPFSS